MPLLSIKIIADILHRIYNFGNEKFLKLTFQFRICIIKINIMLNKEEIMTRQDFLEKFAEGTGNFIRLKSVAALRDGFVMTLPFTVVGSIFLLLANIPVPGYAEFVTGIFGDTFLRSLNSVSTATFSIISLIVLISITYHFVLREGCDTNMACLLALTTFLILNPPNFTTKSGEILNNVITKEWVGANGLITAIFVAFFAGNIFCYCIKKRWVISLPSSVPRSILRAFDGVIPATILFTSAAIISGICHAYGSTTFPELIFKLIQIPLQGLSDSIFGASAIVALQSFFFWLGVHGPNLLSGIVTPLVFANSMDNQALIDAGVSLVGNPDVKIFTQQVNQVFIRSGGCGATMGLIIASLLTAKSRQIKSVTRVAIIPGIFNINEPLIFGIPIMFNPYLIAPYILAPLSSLFITWFAISSGFMSPMGALMLPWTTPPILYGFFIDGWHGAIVQIANIIAATIIYLPFLKMQDNECLEEESEEDEDFEDNSLV